MTWVWHIPSCSTRSNQWQDALFSDSPFLGIRLGITWSKTEIWSVYLNSMISGSSVLQTCLTLPVGLATHLPVFGLQAFLLQVVLLVLLVVEKQ